MAYKKLVELPKHLKNPRRLASIWLSKDRNYTIKYIAYQQCTTEEVIRSVLDNYDYYENLVTKKGG